MPHPSFSRFRARPTPEDIAAMVLVQASEESKWITAQAVVYGGMTAGAEAGRFTAREEFAGQERYLSAPFWW
jgi:hypothetical protein